MKHALLVFSLLLFTVLRVQSQVLLPVGNGIPSTYGIYDGTVSYGNQIYAADSYQIYKWNGTTWASLGITVDYAILCMVVYNNELYVAGWFEHFNGIPVNRIIKYDGNFWQAVGNGIIVPSNWTSGVSKMIVYNNKLIALGGFIQAGNVVANNIASWDGAMWDSLGSGLSGSASLPSMCVWNSELYVFTQMSTAGGVQVHNAAKWNGASWSAVGNPSFFWPVSSTVYNNNIYVGVWIGSGDTSSMIVKWDGISWSDVEQNLSDALWNVPAELAVFNGCLYAAGLFDTIDGVAASNIARYDGGTWFPVGNGVNGWGNYFTILNNELYLTGDFTNSGSTVVNHVVKVSQAPVCTVPVEEIFATSSIEVFPNPATSQFVVHSPSLTSKNEIFVLINSFGQEVKRVTLTHGEQMITCTELASGIYFYTVISDGEIASNGKLIKE